MAIKLISYNSTGSGPTKLDFIKYMLGFSTTVMLVQETWHLKHNEDKLTGLDGNYSCFPCSAFNERKELIVGRPSGGLACYYHKEFGSNVKHIKTDSNRICAICINLTKNYCLLVVNVYGQIFGKRYLTYLAILAICQVLGKIMIFKHLR